MIISFLNVKVISNINIFNNLYITFHFTYNTHIVYFYFFSIKF